jgi:ribosomal protein S12 methylthiotransferase accessory factor
MNLPHSIADWRAEQAKSYMHSYADLLKPKTPKRYFQGTHRSMPPEETWLRIAPMLQRFGVTRVADITGLDRIGISVAIAIRPMSRSIAVAAGKGDSLVAAKVSAAMEAIECAHAETIDHPLKFASRMEISAKNRAPEFSQLPLLEHATLCEQSRLLWIEGVSIEDGEPVMVPYELVHAHYCPFNLPASGEFLATTNGLSSGNTFTEAISHGLFEVIERDALNLWSRQAPAQRRARLLRLPLECSPLVQTAIQRFEHAGFQIAVWDITSNIQVPAFHCLIVDKAYPDGHPGTGTGCHPDKHIAIFRALSEAAQVRGVYISGGRDDLVRSEYKADHMQSFLQLVDHQLDGHAHGRSFADIPSRRAEFFEEDIGWATKRLTSVGCGPVIVVDLSQPGTDISVVRVVVPGLEGPHADNGRPGERAQGLAN